MKQLSNMKFFCFSRFVFKKSLQTPFSWRGGCSKKKIKRRCYLIRVDGVFRWKWNLQRNCIVLGTILEQSFIGVHKKPSLKIFGKFSTKFLHMSFLIKDVGLQLEILALNVCFLGFFRIPNSSKLCLNSFVLLWKAG